MLPSMPLISTPYKELHDGSETSSDLSQMEMCTSSLPLHQSSSPPVQHSGLITVSHGCLEVVGINHDSEDGQLSTRALDLSIPTNVSSKKSSPLKHVTPILKKYNCHRKGKGNKKISLINKGGSGDQPQLQQGTEKQSLRPIAPKPVMIEFTPTQQLTQDSNSPLEQVLKKDKNEDSTEHVTEVKQETVSGTKITNGATDESKTKKTAVDEKTSEEKKNVSAERKDNEDELAALMLASTTIRSSKGRTTNVMRKRSKQMRDMESSLTLLKPDIPAVREEKSYGFAQAYFMKVKERLEGTDLYQEFLYTMNEFGNSIVDVSDLYKKVIAVLNQHPDLCEEFLAFLLPEQAMQCGKFMEYLMITKMRDFFRKLEIYFEKQPQQMRKIYTNLSVLSNQPNVSVGDVRSVILPLLKGNSLLVDNFLALLPQERPPESLMTEFEDMDFGDADTEHLGEEELFETLVVPDQQDAYGGDGCACRCHDSREDKYRNHAAHCVSCGTRFIHGKVFLHTGKVLRPAKVVFDAENSNDSIKRLSAKSRPKGRNRRRAASQTENTNSSKDNSPLKPAHVNSGDSRTEGNGNGGTDNSTAKSNVKSSSLKYARATKAKASGTALKGREKGNSAKTTSASKHNSSEGKEVSNHRGTVREQKQSSSARLSRLSANKQAALASKPVVSFRNIASAINSASVCISVPKISNKNSNNLLSSTFQDKTIVGTAVSTIPCTNTSITETTVTSPPTGLQCSKNIILSIPTVSLDKPNIISSMTPATSGSCDVTLPTIVHDESAILPPDSAAMDSSIKDFSALSRVLQSGAIHRKKDSNCKSDNNNSCQLLRTVEETVGRSDPSPCEVYVPKEVMEVVSECRESSGTRIAACDTTMNDVVMLEHEEQVLGSEGANTCVNKKESCLQPTNQISQEEKCNSDTTSGSWTREEDKIILQMFQLDCSMEQTFIKIGEQLPLRTLTEIKSRFQILMNLLQQMTGVKMDEDSNNLGQ